MFSFLLFILLSVAEPVETEFEIIEINGISLIGSKENEFISDLELDYRIKKYIRLIKLYQKFREYFIPVITFLFGFGYGIIIQILIVG